MGLTVKPLDIYAANWELENKSVEKKTTAPKKVDFMIRRTRPNTETKYDLKNLSFNQNNVKIYFRN